MNCLLSKNREKTFCDAFAGCFFFFLLESHQAALRHHRVNCKAIKKKRKAAWFRMLKKLSHVASSIQLKSLLNRAKHQARTPSNFGKAYVRTDNSLQYIVY